eukprot:c3576_g1_i1 orf=16-318(-)
MCFASNSYMARQACCPNALLRPKGQIRTNQSRNKGPTSDSTLKEHRGESRISGFFKSHSKTRTTQKAEKTDYLLTTPTAQHPQKAEKTDDLLTIPAAQQL